MGLIFYVGRFSTILFFPLQNLNPVLSILVVSVLTTLIINLYKKFIFEKSGFKKIKREMDEIKERVLKYKEDSNKYIERLMELNKTVFKQTIKVLLLSLIIGFLSLSWIHYNYSGSYIRTPIPFFKNLNMVYFYLLLTFIISIVLSKLLEVSI